MLTTLRWADAELGTWVDHARRRSDTRPDPAGLELGCPRHRVPLSRASILARDCLCHMSQGAIAVARTGLGPTMAAFATNGARRERTSPRSFLARAGEGR